MSKEHAYAYEAGYIDGSTHYELEHCPACKNIADLQEALAENAKLRELLRMAVFVLWSMEQVSGLRFVGDGTTFDSAYFKARLRELGIVDSDEWMA